MAVTKSDRYIAQTVAKAWTRIPEISEMYNCNCSIDDNLIDTLWHIISSCQTLETERYHFLSNVEWHCGKDVRCFLELASEEEFVTSVLNGSCCCDQIRPNFMKLAVNYIFICVKSLDTI